MNNRGSIRACLSVALLLSTAPIALAIDVVTGDGLPYSGISSLSRETDRVIQQYFDGSFFSAITEPMEITAMSFRLPAVAGENYPSLGDLNFGRYDITLAAPSAAASMANGLTSATFADNMSNPHLVRSGAMAIPQNSFVSNGIDEDAEFSFIIHFDTPYLFTPGQDLIMLVRHDGHGDVHGVETRWNFDGYARTNGMILSTGNVDDEVANFGPGAFDTANRIQFTFVPAPGGLCVVAGFGALTLRRRR